MGMVHVRQMRVLVTYWFVSVQMRVGFAGRVGSLVHMLMVRVVHVRVGMLGGLVSMIVVMVLGEVEPDADGHE